MSVIRKKPSWPRMAAISFALLLITGTAFSVANPVMAARAGRAVKNQLRKAVDIGAVYHSIGRLWVNVTNWGWMGDDNMVTPSMEWPGGSNNHYLYQGSIWVAGRDSLGTLHATAGDEEEFYPLLSQARIDSFKANGWSDFTTEEYAMVVASATMGHNLDPDYVLWYDKDEYGKRGIDDDGDGAVDEDPLDYIDNDGDGLINEDFAAVSEEDTYAIYNDLWLNQHASGDTPLGVEVIERTYAWSYSYAQDFVIYDYEVINVGTSSKSNSTDLSEIVPDEPQTITDLYIAIRFDFDISSVAAGEYWYDDLTAYLASDKLSYGWDGDDPEVEGNDAGEFGLSTGYLGVRTLDYSEDDKRRPGGPHIPSSHNWWTIDDDPSSDALKFQFMSNGVYAAEPPSPYDYRYLHSVGPWDLAPGDTIRWIAAVGVGEGLGDPANPDPHNTKGSLRDVLAFAQELYDADWLAATPPPIPDVTVTLQADGSVLMDWSAGQSTVEDYIDPLSGEKDFEGYRVYKSDRTDAAGARVWLPLASFDIAGNGVGGETGLKYEFVDRDVLKGFSYYYSVTSFDNGLTPIGELESSKGAGIAVQMAAPPADDLDDVAVVPNPYLGSAIWDHLPTYEEQWWAQIQFINLPEGESTIRVYTLSGDFLIEIVNDDGDSFESWDLITRKQGDIVSGVYLFVVEDADGNTKVGKFVVIR
ncbi:MAG: hypothetical protein JSU77_02610 [Fidelibacterota bacterium]|nr:MAG: hypothetical protein JSU77_02610 [Candidatus Neomarinimicrobiota bacterium]